MLDLPLSFQKTIRTTFGSNGELWLARLPQLIKKYAQTWQLTVGPPFPNLSYNFVAPAQRSDGTAVVLKLGVPNKELTSEIEALTYYNSRLENGRLANDGHVVSLLNANREDGALLLEHLYPGQMLAALPDDKAIPIWTATVKTIHQIKTPIPAEHFPSIIDWLTAFDRIRQQFPHQSTPLPAQLLDKATSQAKDLRQSTPSSILLHGDLHQMNILSTNRQPGWLAIDPKGVIGEPICELAPFLYNGLPPKGSTSKLRAILHHRIAAFAEQLNWDPQRIAAWAFVQMILSACWSIEDNAPYPDTILTLAQLLP